MKDNKTAAIVMAILLSLFTNPACTGNRRLLNEKNLESKTLFLFQQTDYIHKIGSMMKQEIRRLGFPVKPLPYSADDISYGTGFFISETGLFLTNYHVIEIARTISLRKPDGRILDAAVLVDDPHNDIAILAPIHKTKVDNWLALGKNEKEIVGNKIKVLGYPFPELRREPTLSVGIISSDAGFTGEPEKFQISAPIQFGNSGGPILNQENEVVGIVNERLDGANFLHATGPLPADLGGGIKAEYAKSLLSICDADDRPSSKSGSVSLSKAMAATALVLVNINNLPVYVQMPDDGLLVMVEFSNLFGFDLIYYTIIELNKNRPENVTAEMKFTGSIAGAPSSSPWQITEVAIHEILNKIGEINQ